MRTKILSVILTAVRLLLVHGLDHTVLQLKKNSNNDTSRRILFGTVADPTDFLYMVRINKVLPTAGSIINNYFILTCAHCLVGKQCTELELYPSTFSGQDEQTIHAVDCYIHEGYEGNMEYENDIGLIKTKEDLFKDLHLMWIPLPVAGTQYRAGTPAVIAGWGRTETGGFPNNLLRADVIVDDWARCNEEFKDVSPECTPDGQKCTVPDIPRNSMCVRGEGPEPPGACNGDSGGPVVIDGLLAGVIVGVLWHDNNCAVGSPTLNMNVADFLPWIYSFVDPGMNLRQIQATR